MLNYRQSNVVERTDFVDEFESVAQTTAAPAINVEEQEFNSRIRDNFDRIVNFNAYNMSEQAASRNANYNRLVNGAENDIRPSSTTMQYESMPRAEIYKDFREEESAEVKLRPRAKFAMFVLTAVIVALSAFVVVNTALLNDMNRNIEGRLSQIEVLQERKSVLDDRLEEVSSDDAIIDAAGRIGMTF